MYLDIILQPIRICARYKPKMGHGAKTGLTLNEFQKLYREDSFYSWFGLDNPLMYTAHKAAGGMTSIYRQIGIGCEVLFRAILRDELGLTEDEKKWSYSVTGINKKKRRLSLDGRIPISAIDDKRKKERISGWLAAAANELHINKRIAGGLQGAVFEIRQGYKSKDSKRQYADIANAATAYTQGYLPCVVLMSSQIDDDILLRYSNEKWAVLTGRTDSGNPLESTYAFFHNIIGYDLAAFFNRNKTLIRDEVSGILDTLLSTGV